MPDSVHTAVYLLAGSLASGLIVSSLYRRYLRQGLPRSRAGAAFTADVLCLGFSFAGSYTASHLFRTLGGHTLVNLSWLASLCIGLPASFAGAWAGAWLFHRLLAQRTSDWLAKEPARRRLPSSGW